MKITEKLKIIAEKSRETQVKDTVTQVKKDCIKCANWGRDFHYVYKDLMNIDSDEVFVEVYGELNKIGFECKLEYADIFGPCIGIRWDGMTWAEAEAKKKKKGQ